MKNKFLLLFSFFSAGLTHQAFAESAASVDLNSKIESQTVTILEIKADKKNDADNHINHEHAKRWGALGGAALGAGAGVGASFIPGAGGAAAGAAVGVVGASGGAAAGSAIGGAAAPSQVSVEAVKLTYQTPQICKEKHGKNVCKDGKKKTEQFVAHLCEYKLGEATMIMDAKGHGRIQPNAVCKKTKPADHSKNHK